MSFEQIITELNKVFEAIEGVPPHALSKILNAFEMLIAQINLLKEENQKLKDENSRLKGEQGKPEVRKQTKPGKDTSSESERAPRDKPKKKRLKKKGLVSVDRTERCAIPKETLPADAQFKGYKVVVVQDIQIRTNNVEFQKEVYYSPSLRKTFIAEIPSGYEGGFGPVIKSLILEMHYTAQVTHSSIEQFFKNHGISISQATIARILTENLTPFHAEKDAIVGAGLASGYQQMDDTSARIKGQNYYTHVLCNAFYTAYFTRPRKDRLTIIEILSQGHMDFHFNEIAYGLMVEMGLSAKILSVVRLKNPASTMNRVELEAFLSACFPNPQNKPGNYFNSQRIIREATSITAYQALPYAVQILLTDDAPQFKTITAFLALCWVHDGRHYKKLTPALAIHQEILARFRDLYWEYYRKLLAYKTAPDNDQAELLRKDFRMLFQTKTGYEELDRRIEKTKLKEGALLLVLQHPELPLHNNTSELGARRQARYRDISFHTMSEAGTEAKDTFMTIGQTAKKLFVNIYHYIHDRITKKYQMPSLADIIEERFQQSFFSTA